MMIVGILFGLFALWCIVGFVIEAIQSQGWRAFIVSACAGVLIIGAILLFLGSGEGIEASEDICYARDMYGCIE